MKILVSLFTLIFAIAVVSLIAAAGYYGLLAARDSILVLETSTRIVLITTVLTTIFAALLVIVGLRAAGHIIVRGRVSGKRLELYSHILMTFRTLIDNETDGQHRNQLMQELGMIYADLLTLASGPTIKAQMAMLTAIQDETIDQQRVEKDFQSLLKNFRRDLGHTDGFELNDLKEVFQWLPSNYRPTEQPQLEK